MKKFPTHWSTFIIAFTDLAGKLILRIYRNEKVFLNKQPLVLHSDNGSSMKGKQWLRLRNTDLIISLKALNH